MTVMSAGIFLYRHRSELEVLVVHPGGPYWARKDAGAWSIPKGEFDAALEAPLVAAAREFEEELGHALPDGDVIDLGSVTQKSGKVVFAFGVEGDLDPGTVISNTFTLEWPPRSGTTVEFAEIDRAEWMTIQNASVALNPAQVVLLERLAAAVASDG